MTDDLERLREIEAALATVYTDGDDLTPAQWREVGQLHVRAGALVEDVERTQGASDD